MFRCYSRRFKFFKGEICIQVENGQNGNFEGKSAKERKIPMFIICKMKTFNTVIRKRI